MNLLNKIEKLTQEIDNLLKEVTEEKIIEIGTGRHRVRVSRDCIINENGSTITLQELKELVKISSFVSSSEYKVSLDSYTINIGCVRGITNSEIYNIIQAAENLGHI